MEKLAHVFRWPTVAREVGYKTVLLCNDRRDQDKSICKSILEDDYLHDDQTLGLYRILGSKNRFLIISFNSGFDLAELTAQYRERKLTRKWGIQWWPRLFEQSYPIL
jgi:hypothetical protein